MDSRAAVVSSFTIIKGSLIDETYTAFQSWDLESSKFDNLKRMREERGIAATSSNWMRDVSKVLNRRFDPAGRDRPLVQLAKGGCDREVWKPLMLWHMTRDEFLVRDFLAGWLYERYSDGTYRVRVEDVIPYLQKIRKRRGVEVSSTWSESTISRVASGLLKMSVDFGLLVGSQVREFASYHLPDESFIYLLHAMADGGVAGRRIIDSTDWRMFLMDAADVERELLRLHQFRRLHYQAAGSLVELDLPCASSADYAGELVG